VIEIVFIYREYAYRNSYVKLKSVDVQYLDIIRVFNYCFNYREVLVSIGINRIVHGPLNGIYIYKGGFFRINLPVGILFSEVI
jgi:hypothetical protein